jgi:hypothetical protein
MGKRKPKLAPLTPEQQEAVHMVAAELFGVAVGYAQALNTYHAGGMKKRPPPPEELDPEVARVTEEWLDALAIKAEEIVMEPFDQEEVSDAA